MKPKQEGTSALSYRELSLHDWMIGERIDRVLAKTLSYSRKQITKMFDHRLIFSGSPVDRMQVIPAQYRLKGHEHIGWLDAAPEDPRPAEAEDVDFSVIAENDHFLIINKQEGLVVHPGAGCHSGTLLNGLLFRYPELRLLPRAGIVHRLDKNTTGIMVIARTAASVQHLSTQIKNRHMQRSYVALAFGRVASQIIECPIGRHKNHRTKMAILHQSGRYAKTTVHSVRFFRQATLVHCHLDTGRTHQIRVHMQHIRHALIGDPVYTSPYRPTRKDGAYWDVSSAIFMQMTRQALHAHKLQFYDPQDQTTKLSFEVPLAPDLASVLCRLEELEKKQAPCC